MAVIQVLIHVKGDREEFLLSALHPGKVIISHINKVFAPKSADWLIDE